MLATLSDVPVLARLLREFVSQEERATRTEREFAADLGGWWERHSASHVAFLARLPSHGAIGMAWLHSFRECHDLGPWAESAAMSRASS